MAIAVELFLDGLVSDYVSRTDGEAETGTRSIWIIGISIGHSALAEYDVVIALYSLVGVSLGG